MESTECSTPTELLLKIDYLEDLIEEKNKVIRDKDGQINAHKEQISNLRCKKVVEEDDYNDLNSKHEKLTKEFQELTNRFNFIKEDEKTNLQHIEVLTNKIAETENELSRLKNIQNDNKILKDENTIFAHELANLDSLTVKQNEEIDQHKQYVKNLEEEIKNLKELFASKKVNESFNYSCNNTIDVSNMTLPEFGESMADIKIIQLEKDLEVVLTDKASLEDKIIELNSEVSNLTSTITEKEVIITNHLNTLEKLNEENNENIQKYTSLSEEFDEAKKCFENKEQDYSQQQRANAATIDALQVNLQNSKAEFCQLKTMHEMFEKEKLDEIATLTSNLDFVNSKNSELNLKIAENENLVSELRCVLDHSKQEKCSLTAELNKCLQQITELTGENEKLSDTQNELKTVIRGHLDSEKILNAQISEHKFKIETLANTLSEDQKKLEKYQSLCKESDDTIVALNSKIDDLNNEKIDLEGKVALLGSRIDELKKENDANVLSIRNLESVIVEKDTALTKHTEVYKQTLEDLVAAQNQNKNLRDEICEYRERENEIVLQLEQQRQTVEKSQSAFEQLQANYTTAQNTISELNDEINKRQIEFDETFNKKDAQLRKLETQMTECRNNCENLEGKIVKLKSDVGMIGKENSQNLMKIGQLQSEINEKEKEIHRVVTEWEKSEEVKRETLMENQRLDSELRKKTLELKAELEDHQKMLDENRLERQQLQTSYIEAQGNISQLNALIATRQNEFDQTLASKDQELLEARTQSKEYKAKIADFETEMGRLCFDLDKSRKETAESLSCIENLQSILTERNIELAKKDAVHQQTLNELEESTKQILKLEADLEELSKLTIELEMQKQLLESNRLAMEELQTNCSEAHNSISKLNDEIVNQQNRFDETLARKDEELQGLQNQSGEYKAMVVDLESKIKDFEDKVRQYDDRYSVKVNENEELTQKIGKLEEANSNLQAERDEMRQTLKGLQKTLSESEENFKKFNDNRDREVIQIYESVRELAHIKHTLEQQLQEYIVKNEQMTEQLQQNQTMIENFEAKIQKKNDKISKFKSLCQQSSEEIVQLQRLVDEHKNNVNSETEQSLNDQISSLTAAKENLTKQVTSLNLDVKKAEFRFKKVLSELDMERKSFEMERKTKERLLKENGELERQLSRLKKDGNQSTSSSISDQAQFKIPDRGVIVNVNTNLSRSSSLNQNSVDVDGSFVSVNSYNLPRGTGSKFVVADEEGEFMDPNKIESSKLFERNECKDDRIKTLMHRNSLLKPHLRSTYPIELQNMIIDENSIRSGSVSSINSGSHSSLSSVENIPPKIRKVESNDSVFRTRSTRETLKSLTPSKIIKRVMNSKQRTWTPNKK